MNAALTLLQAGLGAVFVLILVFIVILAVLLALIAVLLIVLIARIGRRDPNRLGVGGGSPGSATPRTEEVPPTTRGEDAPAPRDVRRETPPEAPATEAGREPPPPGPPPDTNPPA